MWSNNPNTPDHIHRENHLFFSNSDVGSLTSPYYTMTEKMQETGPTV